MNIFILNFIVVHIYQNARKINGRNILSISSLFRALASCLESIHCPLNIKSYGSLILNLLHLLGISNCDNNDRNSSCPNEKRSIILHNLLTHWTDNRVTNNDDYSEQNHAEIDTYCR
jgi:hypothetical protein